jgi:hypothetical protein
MYAIRGVGSVEALKVKDRVVFANLGKLSTLFPHCGIEIAAEFLRFIAWMSHFTVGKGYGLYRALGMWAGRR